MQKIPGFVRHVVALMVVLGGLVCARPAAAETLTLQWDFNSEPEVTGYIVYVGLQSRSYSQSFDVGNANSFVFNGAPGQRYYFAVVAYAGTVASDLSDEVSGETTASSGNGAPLLVSPGNQTSIVGQAVSLQLAGSDPEGQPVTYSASGLPNGLTVGQLSGLIVGIPTTVGSYGVTVTVSDGGLTTQRMFTWTVMQSAPQPTTTTAPTEPLAPTASGTPTISQTGDTETDTTRSLRGNTTRGTYTGSAATRRPASGSTGGTRTRTSTAALSPVGVSTSETSAPATTSGAPLRTRTTQSTTASETYTGGVAVRSVATAPASGETTRSYSGTTATRALETSSELGTSQAMVQAPTTTTAQNSTTSAYSAPVVRIQTPTDQSTVASGTPIIFSGVAEDAEDGTITRNITWSSSIDGHVGTGGLVYKVLSTGVHIVTASVSDRTGTIRSARVTVVVK